MKKIINKPENVVVEACKGLVQAHPELEFIEKYKVVKKRELNPNKVCLISGGGSGHEPAHAGFIGQGMLDAAVCGDVFASPSQIQIYQALKSTQGSKGTLLIIKNYSGDMMNFKNAAYLASEDGIQVEYIKVEDDIAVEDSLYTVGRRGVAGTVLVHKIVGAAAEKGWSLEQVKAVGQKAADHVRSIGFALTSCTVPAKGTPTFELEADEMEYGVGIHGEPGIRKEKIASADVLAKRMVEALQKDLQIEDGSNQEVALLVNGFGGTPLQELYLLGYAASKVLREHGIVLSRSFAGNYMTSLDMAGASISLMKLDRELKELLDCPAKTPAFHVSSPVDICEVDSSLGGQEDEEPSFEMETDPSYGKISGGKITLSNMIYLVDGMSECIIKNEVPFCDLDSHAGDGDFGMSVAKGFRQLKREWKGILRQQTDSIGMFLQACSMVIMEHCGGASGPIWGSAFRAAGKATEGKTELTAVEFAEMLQAAVKGVQQTGQRSFGRGAVVGDKTLMDALIPCADVWTKEAGEGTGLLAIFEKAGRAAAEGADKTKEIVARMGRAGTVGERSIGYPDAGAYALGVIFSELADKLSNK